jgi:hypothetical protein
MSLCLCLSVSMSLYIFVCPRLFFFLFSVSRVLSEISLNCRLPFDLPLIQSIIGFIVCGPERPD